MRAVLWYVHHHGVGHWRRAIAVAATLPCRVLVASSAAPPWPLPGNVEFTRLAPDFPAPPLAEPSANGRLHWAPERQPGLLNRHAELLRLAGGADVAVVDVSVEVGVLLRVSGLPVIAVRLPGDRTDEAHRLLHDVARTAVMPVPASWGLGAVGVGLVPGVAGEFPRVDAGGPVVVVRGTGGSAFGESSLALLTTAVGDRRRVVVADGDVAPLLAEASVVVGGTGLGTVADVARAGRPFVGLPAERPFGEQVATGRALARHEAAHIAFTVPPDVEGWCAALADAEARGPLRADTDGAQRFADLIMAAQ